MEIRKGFIIVVTKELFVKVGQLSCHQLDSRELLSLAGLSFNNYLLQHHCIHGLTV